MQNDTQQEDAQGYLDDGSDRNLSNSERLAYVVVGLGLAAAGVKPRPNPLLNVAALGAGVYLALTGYRGSCPVKAALIEAGAIQPRIAA